MVLIGVGHLEVVELPSGVISVPMSLLEVSLNRNLSLNGSKHSDFNKFLASCTSFVNLSAISSQV